MDGLSFYSLVNGKLFSDGTEELHCISPFFFSLSGFVKTFFGQVISSSFSLCNISILSQYSCFNRYTNGISGSIFVWFSLFSFVLKLLTAIFLLG